MATQLNPGADQALVAAAYRASMANVPQDYSKAFGEIAKGYAVGVEGIEAAIKPLVQGTFSEVAEASQKLIKKWGGKALDIVGQELGDIFKPYNSEKADLEAEQEIFTDQQQTFVDSDLFKVDLEGCLLYTSPSPRDATLSRMPSSA